MKLAPRRAVVYNRCHVPAGVYVDVLDEDVDALIHAGWMLEPEEEISLFDSYDEEDESEEVE